MTDTTRASLARALEARRGRHRATRAITPVPDGDTPLAPVQEALWFMARLDPDDPAHHRPAAFTVRGAVTAADIEAALAAVVDRHEPLRTSYHVVEGAPVQRVHERAVIDCDAVDLRAVAPDERASRVDALARAHARRAADLEHADTLRATVVATGPAEHVLVIGVHHLACDGWSGRLLADDLASALNGTLEPRPTGVRYRDWAQWRRARVTPERAEAQLAHWRSALSPRPPRAALADHAAVGSPAARVDTFTIERDVADALRALARAEGLTLFAVTLAALQKVLADECGARDLVVAVPAAGRDHPDVEPLVGCFINVLPLRVRVPDDATIRSLAHAAGGAMTGALAHSDVTYGDIVADLGGSARAGALHDVLFQVRRFPTRPHTGVQVDPYPVPTTTAALDVTVEALDDDLVVRAVTDPRRVGPRTAHRLVDAFAAALEATAVRPDAPVAATEPHADGVARALAERGVGPGALVAVDLDAPSAVPVLAGIHRAGCAYLPLDRNAPEARTAAILADARPDAAITAAPERFPGVPVVVDASEVATGRGRGGPLPAPAANPEALAYVVYTSGSTGAPKGVEITRGALDAFVAAAAERYGLRPDDRILQFHSIAFDAAVEEIFVALACGATLVHLDRDALGSMARFLAFVEQARITVLDLPTGFFHELVHEVASGRVALPPALRLVLIGGEAARADLVRAWQRVAGDRVRLVNTYGPTEATVVALSADLTHAPVGDDVPIGRPLAGVVARVLDRDARPITEPGTEGELALGGPQLARGYRHDPDRTAARFVDDPLDPGARLYRTGDRVVLDENGDFWFRGRIDDQVKVRGFRVEPGEVESAIRRQAGVREAAVVAVDGAAGVELVAHCTGAVDPESLLRGLAAALPPYMLPTRVEVLDALPRLTSGKVDRRLLSERSRVAATPAPPPPPPPAAGDAGAERLAGLWHELLGRVPGTDDDFFTSGGNSLLAVRLLSRLEAEFGVSVPLRTVFERSTFTQLHEVVRASEPAAAPAGITRLYLDRAPLSPAQERLWFLEQLDPETPAYHIVWAGRLEGDVDLRALEDALRAVTVRHEALRTRFVTDGTGRPLQVIEPEIEISIDKQWVAEEEVDSHIRSFARTPFDLVNGPLLRAALLAREPGEHVLVLVVHHIAIDGPSFDVLLDELAHGYRAALGLPADDLPALPVQITDVSIWQQSRVRSGELDDETHWWRERFTPRPEPVDLGLRPGAGAAGRRPGGYAHRSVTGAAALDALGRAHGATPFMTALAALAIVLSRAGDTDDLVVGIPGTERSAAGTEHVLGFLVNTLPLRLQLDPDAELGEWIERVRDVVVDALAHGNVPFERIVDAVQPARDPFRTPLLPVVFTAVPQSVSTRFDLPGVRSTLVDTRDATGTARFDLMVWVKHGSRTWTIDFEYDASRFDALAVDGLADAYAATLEAFTAHSERREAALALAAPTGTGRDPVPYERDATLTELFDAASLANPDAVAVSDAQRSLTYAELREEADHLATRLRTAGVRAGHAVGVAIERRVELAVALLAIVRADAVYVPVDPASPPARREQMLDTVGAAVVLGAAGGDVTIEVRATPARVHPGRGALAPCYVMFTSGSTGTPKGVVVPHRAVARLVRGTDYVQLGPDDVVACASNPAFDALTWEVWGAFANGARLVMIDHDTVVTPDQLEQALREHGVSAIFLTTAVFDHVARTRPGAFATVRHVLFGGEAADPDAVRAVRAAGGPARLLNVYGPTESTTFASWFETDHLDVDATTVPIGGAIAHTTLHVLDRRGHPVPDGVPGELHIGGDGLALGYLDDPELSARRFVADPFSAEPGARMYRTGDRVRRRADGAIEFLGRRDGQVKLRGHRIELGEIEAALVAHPSVRAAVAAVVGDGAGRDLGAWVVADEVDPLALRSWLRDRVPSYMVPTRVFGLDRIPITPNGKVDRRALAWPDPTGDETDRVPPEADAATVAMCEVWRRVLRLAAVGPDDDFFDLGGHSLRAVELLTAVEARFGLDLALAALLEAPTPRALAARVDAAAAGPEPDDPRVLVLGGTGDASPLWLLPPGGGEVFLYRPLVAALDGGRPVLTLQMPGLDGREAPLRTVPALTEWCVSAIRASQPAGPYLLAGYSLGGVLAYEVARVLRAAGERVTFVGLIDANLFARRTASEWAHEMIAGLRDGDWRVLGRRTRERLRRARALSGYRRRMRRDGRISADAAHARTIATGERALDGFRPGPYDGEVVFLRACGSPEKPDDFRSDVPWSELTTLTVHDVPGNHLFFEDWMLASPNVEVLGAVMAGALAEVPR